ncbi:Putative 2OG-Fe(II) oxygenase [Sphingomonas guangdongensis]|uniref:2OG-Fe(II) oxygenase n=1 Tax=Sphingomonas guangdongensis TaxID=1141890 RepID=A0A285QY06_9SPHN|nr:putative 2OG-Fe(II) oxygenase [Sphingomonas guangdongensis]SOB86855.1 Putative 2OG-Fe(II) oxygenase [Sphingomonas guangdongensis]
MNAAALRQQALARAAAGDQAGATALFARGLEAHPRDAAFANSAGSFHAGQGRPAEALALFDRALAIAPDLHEAAVNRAIMLQRLGRTREALADLRARERSLAAVPRYWTTRASAERALGDVAAAATSYDRAIAREPANPKALAGRAQMAIERGEADAVAAHQRALAQAPGDPHLLLGFAHALHAAGALDDALYVSGMLVQQYRTWPPGMELHAELRRAAGDQERFTDHYVGADTVELHLSWAAMLAGVDRQVEAAAVLAAAQQRFPTNPNLILAEAVAAGEAGDDARAAALFRDHAAPTPAWQVAEARQRLRTGDPAAAEALLAAALRAKPDDVVAWSLRDLSWRLLGDARHHWLHGQDRLVQVLRLELSTAELDAARAMLDRLHDRSPVPIGQSVRHGSQTRGALFLRAEPAISRVAEAIRAAIERYREGLPPADAAHPLLRHRDTPLAVVGSWSIRLDGAGHHAAHVHPQGVLSSAAYLAVPEQVTEADQPGWLELGRPPVTLLDLPPLRTIEPKVGELALFPSTLFHGTRPISAGRRMTVAFDAAPRS